MQQGKIATRKRPQIFVQFFQIQLLAPGLGCEYEGFLVVLEVEEIKTFLLLFRKPIFQIIITLQNNTE
jgi:hypothetical protein